MSPQHRFSGPELGALLERVRQELGAEAQIHEANKVRSGGVAGFFASESFEVIASAEPAPAASKPAPAAPRPASAAPRPAPARERRNGAATRAEPRDNPPQVIETAARSNHRPAGVAAGLLDRADEVSVAERITRPSRGEVDLRTPPRFDQVLAAEVRHAPSFDEQRVSEQRVDDQGFSEEGVDLDFRFDSGTPGRAVPSVDLTMPAASTPPPPSPAPTITVTNHAPTSPAAPSASPTPPSPASPNPTSPSAARFWTALSGVEGQLLIEDPDRRSVFMGSLDAAVSAADTAKVTATVLTPSAAPDGAAPWMCFRDPAEITARLMWHDSQQHGEAPAPIVIDLALGDRAHSSLDRVRSHGPTTVHLAITENLSVKDILSRFSTIGGKVVLDIVHEAPPAYVIGLIDHGIRIASVGGRRFDAGLALALRQAIRPPAPSRG